MECRIGSLTSSLSTLISGPLIGTDSLYSARVLLCLVKHWSSDDKTSIFSERLRYLQSAEGASTRDVKAEHRMTTSPHGVRASFCKKMVPIRF